MISPNRIKFRNICSNELSVPDLIMDVAFDGDDSETATYLNREGVSVESYDGRRSYTTKYKYSERFSPRFTFLKKGFGDFDSSDVRAVLKWLTSSDTPTLLDVYYDDSDVVEFSAIGNWTEINSYKLANSRTVAVVATFEAVHPFALSDLYTVTKTISNATNNKITIDIDTDDNQPIYPKVTIQENGTLVPIASGTTYTILSDMVENTVYFNGTTYYWKTPVDGPNTTFNSASSNPGLQTTSVRLTNTHTDFLGNKTVLAPVVIKNNNSTEKIIVDGSNQVIYSESNAQRVFGNDFNNWRWLALYDGTNEIKVEGNCTVTLEWRCVKKIGEY